MLDPPCKSKSSEGVFFAGEEGKTQNYAGCRAGVVFREVQWDTTGDRRLTCRSVVGSHRAGARSLGVPVGHLGGGSRSAGSRRRVQLTGQ